MDGIFSCDLSSPASIALLVPLGLSALWWGIQLVGICLVKSRIPRLDKEEFLRLYATAEIEFPMISVIVPARDEAEYVEAALRSKLGADYPNLEVVFVDDRSKDGTSAIADRLAEKEPRLKVVHIDLLPKGWLGKVNAMHRGAASATGEWILLTDADVHLSGDLLKRAMALVQRERLDHLAAVPAVLPRTPVLTACLAAFFRMLMVFTRSFKTSDPRSTAFFGCGAFNLVRRSFLEKTPGFELLKMEISDDAALGAMLKAHGARQQTAFLGRLSRLEFYPRLGSLFVGLEKNGAMTPWPLVPFIGIFLIVLELGYLFAFFQLERPLCAGLGAATFLVGMMTQLIGCRSWGSPGWPALLPGMGSIVFALALFRSALLAARQGGVKWRDTFYTTAEIRQGAVLGGLVRDLKQRVKRTS